MLFDCLLWSYYHIIFIKYIFVTKTYCLHCLQNLEQRCTTTNTNLNQLMLDLDTTKVKLGNATTKLLDLNNAKFVEHTVMDIDSLSNVDKSFIAESDKVKLNSHCHLNRISIYFLSGFRSIAESYSGGCNKWS